MNLNFDIDTALQLSKSQEKFPVDFQSAYLWLGYTRKDNAKRSLVGSGFIKGEDFLIREESTSAVIENIFLTVECFKMWSMMSGTEQGKQVRL